MPDPERKKSKKSGGEKAQASAISMCRISTLPLSSLALHLLTYTITLSSRS